MWRIAKKKNREEEEQEDCQDCDFVENFEISYMLRNHKVYNLEYKFI